MGKRQKNWKKWFLKYFDGNNNDEIDVTEILIPVAFIVLLEIFVEFIAHLLF